MLNSVEVIRMPNEVKKYEVNGFVVIAKNIEDARERAILYIKSENPEKVFTEL